MHKDNVTSPQDTVNENTWAVLGYLRFFLASCVAVGHIYFVTGSHDLPPILQWLSTFEPTHCVFCFFIISGFSIASSLERNSSQFLMRRAWRIYPVYVVGLIISLVPFAIGGHRLSPGQNSIQAQMPSLRDVAMNAICLPWIITPAIVSFNQTWSLTCEVIYYVCAPILLTMQTKYIGLIAIISYVIYCANQSTPWAFTLFLPVIALTWLWFAGFLLYRHRTARSSILIVAAFLWLAAGFNLVTLVTLAALIFGGDYVLDKQLARLGKYLGDVSYPMYITHIAIYLIVYLMFKKEMAPIPGAYTLIALVTAIAIYQLVDLPIRRLRIPKGSLLSGK